MRLGELPPAARQLADAVVDAVEAARGDDAPAYDEAVARLAVQEPERVGLVLGAVVRQLLEDVYPDGLAADEVLDALDDAVRGAAAWAAVDTEVLVSVVAGALGIHEVDTPEGPERPRSVRPVELAGQAPLLVAALLRRSRRPLRSHLELAFGEIWRAETVELP
ncbi:hypothetical protein G9H71_00250 [Motilibacter sp. E257]|uniref:Uncharacterized protein n=1 Tax=Motilibacter deserti TaxID=2714956 RepID=A0ABX0GR31_9ACTN|nr:hypothetical protein [Motilibacter deserti]